MEKKTPERLALEERAAALGVKFQANIGDEKLQKKVEDAEAAEAAAEADAKAKTEANAKAEADAKAKAEADAEAAEAAAKTEAEAKAKATSQDLIAATVLDHLNHDGEDYDPGDPVELPRKAFDRLEELKVVKAAD